MTRSNSADDDRAIQALLVTKELTIDAPQDVVWESVLAEMGPGMEREDGKGLSMKIEAWPGGRWYRDLGENVGHLWGHVQVIKPPTLLEICGPMFMSYAAANHVQWRLSAEGQKTKMTLTHRGIGQFDPEHLKGVNQGWAELIENIRKAAERRARR